MAFSRIWEVVGSVLETWTDTAAPDLAALLEADREAREAARQAARG
jgi:1-deoxy-D-xylulose 5-phosphate reductoisomerase